MKFDRINRLVGKEWMFLQAWRDRYNKGIWVGLGFYESEIDVIRDLSSAGDYDMEIAMDFIEAAKWLPYVTAPTFYEGLEKLEKLLSKLPQDELKPNGPWGTVVSSAIIELRDAFENRSSSLPITKPETLKPLPETLELAIARYDKEEDQD